MSEERGFTLVEVLVAFFLLAVGMAGTALMLDTANQTTAGTKAREQGIGLQREVLEAARSAPYDQLGPSTVVAAVQSKPGLGTVSGNTSWKVERGGVVYTVTLGACSVDDVSDGIGAHDTASVCATSATDTTPARCRELLTRVGSGQPPNVADGAAIDVGRCGLDLNGDGAVDNLVEASGGCSRCTPTTPADQTPDDYKRMVTLVTWDRGTGGRYALQSATVPNPGSAAAIRIDALTRTPTTDSIDAGTSVSFSATPSRPPAAVAWSVNGAVQKIDPALQPALNWQWALGEVGQSGAVLDGSYIVGARASDARGIAGPTRSMAVVVNRRQPFPPAGFVAGPNGGAVEFEWTANQERDIEGYKVYRVVDGGRELACALTGTTSCRLLNGPDGDYYVVAVDRDAAGVLREGDLPLQLTTANNVTAGAYSPPQPPSEPAATREGDAVTLSWRPSPSTDVEFYRIYRDGQAYEHRYDRKAGAPDSDGIYRYVDTQTEGTTHSYSITAVNGKLGESAMVGPVTR